MSARLRLVCIAGLLVTCAAALGTGCSDDSSTKKKAGSAGEAGEAGEAGQPASGAGGKGGSGGMAPTAGEGGLPSEAGQGGADSGNAGAAGTAEAGATSGEGGAAGAPPIFACTPSGTVAGVTFVSEGPQTVCRGARIQASFNANDALGRFQCCGVSDGTTPYGVVLSGLAKPEVTFGDVSLTVPTDAPLGAQSITATCTDGAATNTIDLNVTDVAVPVVTGISPVTIFPNQTITLAGEGLDQGSQVFAVPDDANNPTVPCNPLGEATPTAFSCNFQGIAPGNYKIVASEINCGAAVNWPNLTVTPAT